MEKQKAIELAYGEYWEKVKDKINEDGWVYEYNISVPIKRRLDSFCEFKLLRYAEIGRTPMFYYRPKSLSGIENNNGWIKIESEYDLPKDDIDCFFIQGTYMYNGLFDIAFKSFCHGRVIVQDVTHYQKIIIPPKPIY